MQDWQLRKLKELRRQWEYTQGDMAKKLGISLPLYIEKENGHWPFDIWEAERIMGIFGKKYEDVF